MKRNRIVVAAAMAALLAVASGAALAMGERCGGGAHGQSGMGPLGVAYHLDDLSDIQRKQLDALRDKMRKEMVQTQDERKTRRDAMAKATDAATLQPLAEQQGKAVTEMIMKQAELRAEVEKILTPVQREKLQTLKSEMDARRGHGPRW